MHRHVKHLRWQRTATLQRHLTPQQDSWTKISSWPSTHAGYFPHVVDALIARRTRSVAIPTRPLHITQVQRIGNILPTASWVPKSRRRTYNAAYYRNIAESSISGRRHIIRCLSVHCRIGVPSHPDEQRVSSMLPQVPGEVGGQTPSSLIALALPFFASRWRVRRAGVSWKSG